MPDTAPSTPSPSLKQTGGKFSDLQAAIKSQYLSLGFMESGQEFHLRVRRLTSAEVDAADAHVRGIVPPLNKRYAGEKDGKPLFDFDNPSPELKALIAEFIEANPLPSYDLGVPRKLTFEQAALRMKYDYNDKEYAKRTAEAQDAQAAVLLDAAIEGGIPGDSAAVKAQALKAALPDKVIAMLVQKVLEISARGTIETASFF